VKGVKGRKESEESGETAKAYSHVLCLFLLGAFLRISSPPFASLAPFAVKFLLRILINCGAISHRLCRCGVASALANAAGRISNLKFERRGEVRAIRLWVVRSLVISEGEERIDWNMRVVACYC